MSPRTVVTGAAGRCGHWLHGHIDNAVYSDLQRPSALGKDEQFLAGDLADPSFCAQLVEDGDVLVHLGGESSANADLETVVRANVTGTGNLVRAAMAARVTKIIFASSNHVIGLVERELAPALYTDPHLAEKSHLAGRQFAPDGYYGASKLFGEGLLDLFVASRPGRCAISLRIGTVWPLDMDDDEAQARGYSLQCQSTGVAPDPSCYRALVARQRAFRVPGPRWRATVLNLISAEWVGHRIEPLVSEAGSWLEAVATPASSFIRTPEEPCVCFSRSADTPNTP
jgi:nucleoside-diphosphate-sugar epimerase